METTSESLGSPQRRVVAASIWVTVGMLAGRLAGIVREFLIADTFGVTRNADVAILLVTGPDVLVTIAGTGALGLVLIPILLEHDAGAQVRLVRRLVLRLGLAALVLSIVTVILVLALASDWATQSGLASSSFRAAVIVTAIAVPPSMVVVVTAAFLRAQDRFALVSFANVTFTAPLLVMIVVTRSVVGVAVGIAAGAALRYLAQDVVVRRSWPPSSTGETIPMHFGRSQLMSSFGISVMLAAQVSLPLLLIAAVGDSGDVALLNYSWRLLFIPIGLLGSIFAVAAYPAIVQRLQSGERSSYTGVTRILRPVVLMSVLVGIWLWINASGATAAVYGPAGLDDIELSDVASGIRVGAVAVPLITIGAAATSVAFGLKLDRLGLVPYLVSTTVLTVLGLGLGASSGPNGVMAAISIYALLLCATGVTMLHRTTGFAIVERGEILVMAAIAVAAVGLSLGIRAAIPGDDLFRVLANGALFSAVTVPVVGLGSRSRNRDRVG